jgi:hypothetical protein
MKLDTPYLPDYTHAQLSIAVLFTRAVTVEESTNEPRVDHPLLHAFLPLVSTGTIMVPGETSAPDTHLILAPDGHMNSIGETGAFRLGKDWRLTDGPRGIDDTQRGSSPRWDFLDWWW